MKLGIVGLPNVGKSTLFNSLTRAGAESANYPFCTIDPNVGIVPVPDERLTLLGDFSHSKKVTPATIEFVDIAGLVKGASKGEGLGNQFLANIRECDAILHVLRCFDDGNVVHVDGNVDPVRDKEIMTWDAAQRLPQELEGFQLFVRPDKPAKITNGSYIIIDYVDFTYASSFTAYYNIFRDEFFAEARIWNIPDVTYDFDSHELPELERLLHEKLVPRLQEIRRRAIAEKDEVHYT